MPTERLRPRGMDGDWTKRKRFWASRQPKPGVSRLPPTGPCHANSLSGKLVDGFEITRSWRHDLESEPLQDLDRVVGSSVQQDSTIREPRVFPFASLSAVTEQTIFKGAVNKQFPVKSYRLLAVHFFVDLFHLSSDPL